MLRLPFIFILLGFFGTQSKGQENYVVKPAEFSSAIWDEFSPVFYKDGIVFCSNQPSSSPISYGDKQSSVFSIFYIPRKDSTKWKYKQLLAREISTDVNDGPATFANNGELIYFSRNNATNRSLRNVNDSTNKLGIYSARMINGKWTNITPFGYNHAQYNFCTPSLSADGNRIYFSSDMPGGYGAMDLYYCEKNDNAWNKPVNLGPLVNTPKSEVFPYACQSGKLFFASDGKPGFGGKDLFYTLEINGSWMEPVHLDSAINSPYDDFGLVTDTDFEKGFFSSNRNKTDDIFSFSVKPLEFEECREKVEDNFCFTFYDEQQPPDTIPLTYEWDFGEGIKRFGTEVKHCFPGPGDYLVKLSIRDKVTGEALVSDVEYEVNLKDSIHPRLNSYTVGLVNKPVFFDGSKNSSSKYFWNFGNGYIPGGPASSYTFSKKGDYTVKLGFIQSSDSLTQKKVCIQEKIRIYSSFEELSSLFTYENDKIAVENLQANHIGLQVRIYLMDDLTKEMKSFIKKELSETIPYVWFDKAGLHESSSVILDIIVKLIRNNPELSISMALHTSQTDKNLSENFARQIAFFFNQKGLDKVKYSVKGFGNTQPLFKPYSFRGESTGVIELMFVKE